MSPVTLRLIGGGLMALGGGLVGAVIADKALEAKYVAISEEEIDQAREYYRNQYQPTDPVELATQLYGIDVAHHDVQEFTSLGVRSEDAEEIGVMIRDFYDAKAVKIETAAEAIEEVMEEAKQEVVSIFDKAETSPGRSIPHPKAVKPYVISNAEYYENEPNHHQTDLVYYEGDAVLCDKKDKPIAEVETMVGEANLELFGTRSKDANIVFVRNEEIGTDFQITRDGRSYEDHVAGFMHHDTGIRRMRGDE